MLSDWSAREVRDRIAAGELTSVEATRQTLDAIARLNPELHAYNSVFAERALQQAAAIDKRIQAGEKVGLLAGVPVSIKDNMCTDYGATTCSSKMLENFHAPYTATAVEKLEAAGAVI